MRALPDLSLLPPLGDVWSSSADDFTQLLSDQSDTFDSLYAQMNPIADQALANVATLDADVDAVGQVFDGIDGTFGQLDTTIADAQIEQEISDALAAEAGLSWAVDNWFWDLASAAAPILAGILGLFDLFYAVQVVPVTVGLAAAFAQIDALSAQISDLQFQTL